MPTPAVVPYGGAKAALNAMTRSLAAEYGPKVRVNTLSPGPFLTDIADAWPAEQREHVDSALGRPGQPEEIVSAAVMLASPVSSYITGAIVRVDGGLPIGQGAGGVGDPTNGYSRAERSNSSRPASILMIGASKASTSEAFTCPRSTRRVTPLQPLAASLQRNSSVLAICSGTRFGRSAASR